MGLTFGSQSLLAGSANQPARQRFHLARIAVKGITTTALPTTRTTASLIVMLVIFLKAHAMCTNTVTRWDSDFRQQIN